MVYKTFICCLFGLLIFSTKLFSQIDDWDNLPKGFIPLKEHTDYGYYLDSKSIKYDFENKTYDLWVYGIYGSSDKSVTVYQSYHYNFYNDLTKYDLLYSVMFFKHNIVELDPSYDKYVNEEGWESSVVYYLKNEYKK